MTAWGELVESDQVFSTKTKAWYEVVETVRNTAKDTVRLVLKNVDTGNTVRQEKPAAEDCGQMKRGATGRTVDMMVTVLYSGPGR